VDGLGAGDFADHGFHHDLSLSWMALEPDGKFPFDGLPFGEETGFSHGDGLKQICTTALRDVADVGHSVITVDSKPA
jgi:hypothetical protein